MVIDFGHIDIIVRILCKMNKHDVRDVRICFHEITNNLKLLDMKKFVLDTGVTVPLAHKAVEEI